MSDATRQTLLYKLKNRRDEEAWEEFCRYYSPYIHKVLQRLNINSRDELDDIAQNVLLSLWKSLPDFDYDPGKGRFRTWLVTVIRNHYNKHARKQIRELEKRDAYEVPGKEDNFEQAAVEEWQQYISSLAWKNIRPHFEEQVLDVFRLALGGQANKEIASELSLKENTVAVYKKRVQQSLHKEIIRLKYELS